MENGNRTKVPPASRPLLRGDKSDASQQELERRLTLERLTRDLDQDFIRTATQAAATNYADIDEDFGRSIVQSNNEGFDKYGFFTKRKEVWVLKDREKGVVGYQGVSMKRGGSVKINPVIIKEEFRGQGMGTYMQAKIQEIYAVAGFRKVYATFSFNAPAMFQIFIMDLGWDVEAILRDQYKVGSHDFVGGRIFKPAQKPVLSFRYGKESSRKIEVTSNISSVDCSQYERFIVSRMQPHYDEIDVSFARSIVDATERFSARGFEVKGKKVFVALDGTEVVGTLVTTPKRGGAVKFSPILLDDKFASQENISLLIKTAVEFYAKETTARKPYAIVPFTDIDIIRALLGEGFTSEGTLREAYKEGVDFHILSKFIR